MHYNILNIIYSAFIAQISTVGLHAMAPNLAPMLQMLYCYKVDRYLHSVYHL